MATENHTALMTGMYLSSILISVGQRHTNFVQTAQPQPSWTSLYVYNLQNRWTREKKYSLGTLRGFFSLKKTSKYVKNEVKIKVWSFYSFNKKDQEAVKKFGSLLRIFRRRGGVYRRNIRTGKYHIFLFWLLRLLKGWHRPPWSKECIG